MKKQSTLVLAALAVAVFPAFAQPSAGDIKANSPNSAYAQDGRGVVARSGYGLCWRTGYWTKADALPECEGDKVAKVPEPAPQPTTKKMSFSGDDFFDYNKATLKPAAKDNLDRLAKDLKNMDLRSVTVTGHTDSRGSDAYNQKLSERRAQSVKAYLISKGVDGKKIATKGMGEKQPAADNATEAGRRQNRRVTIDVVGTAK